MEQNNYKLGFGVSGFSKKETTTKRSRRYEREREGEGEPVW